MRMGKRKGSRNGGLVERCAHRHADFQKAHEECTRGVGLLWRARIRSGAFRRGYKVSVVYEMIAARAAEDGDWELESANT